MLFMKTTDLLARIAPPPSLEELPKFARAWQVMAYLGLSYEATRKLIDGGLLVPHRFMNTGRRIYYREEVLAFEREHRIERPALKKGKPHG